MGLTVDTEDLQQMDDVALQKLMETSRRNIADMRGKVIDLKRDAVAEEKRLQIIWDEINRRLRAAAAERGE